MNQENQSAPASFCESELVARAQSGEEKAFEALYQAHKRRVYALFLRMTGSTADAEDLTQEAFMQVFRKIHTFRGDSAFSTWLHRLPDEIPIQVPSMIVYNKLNLGHLLFAQKLTQATQGK